MQVWVKRLRSRKSMVIRTNLGVIQTFGEQHTKPNQMLVGNIQGIPETLCASWVRFSFSGLFVSSAYLSFPVRDCPSAILCVPNGSRQDNVNFANLLRKLYFLVGITSRALQVLCNTIYLEA